MQRYHHLFGQLFFLGLLALAAAQQPVTATPGFLSQSQFASCSEYENVLSCGNTANNVTVLSIDVVPGTGGQNHYYFNSVSNVKSNPAFSDITGEVSCPSSGGDCTVTTQYRLTLTVDPLVVYYEIQDISLNVPYFYSAHYTSINNQVDGDDYKDSINVCHGEAETRIYDRADEPPTNPELQATPAASIGVYFARVCTLETGPYDYGRIDYKSVPPIVSLQPGTFSFDTYSYPNAWRCTSRPSSLDGKLTSFANEYAEAQGFFGLRGEKLDDNYYSSLVCAAPRADMMSYNNQDCPYLMYYYNGRYDFLLRSSTPDNGPTSQYAVCGNPAYPNVTNQEYMDHAGSVYPPNDWHAGFDYNLNINGVANIAANNARYSAEPLPTQGKDFTGRCNRVISYLNDQSPLRQYYGNWVYQGAEYAKNIRSFMAEYLEQVRPGSLMTWRKHPVIIGCGDFFSDPDVTPVSYDDTQPPYYKSSRQSFGTRYKNSNFVIPCGTNDFFCGTGQVGYINAEGKKVVSWARCYPSDGCGLDRIGIMEHKNKGSPRRYQTADTMGMGGPTCQVNAIQSTAKPLLRATATLERSDGMGGWKIVSNTTVTNLSQQELGQVFGNANVEQTAQTLNFFGRQGNSEPSKDMVINLQFDYFNTPNGQIAPDFDANLNLIICNTTVNNVLGQIYMADVNNPMANPWEKIDAAYRKENNGNAKPGGYTPLAKYLRYVLDERTPNVNGTWFAWAPADWFGFGPGQLGLQPQWYADNFNAQYTCSRGRYATVPGHIESFDWTIQDRITDQVMNQGRQERELRKSLKVCTPCVINGFLRDYDQQETCDNFRNYDPNNPLRFLFPSWVAPGEGSSCNLPRCWINGLYVFCNSDATTVNQVSAAFRVAVLGTVISTETVISGGEFQFDADHKFSCAVDQGNSGGTMRVYVHNTGTSVGTYQVYGNCTNNIVLTPTIVPDTPADGVTTVDINVSQVGLLPNSTLCSVFLRHPTYTNIIFDRFDTTGCVVLENSDLRTIRYEATQSLCEMVGQCDIVDPTQQTEDARNVAAIVSVIAIFGVLIGFIVIAVWAEKKSKEYRSRKRGLVRATPK